mgnify:CR=1 FL=1
MLLCEICGQNRLENRKAVVDDRVDFDLGSPLQGSFKAGPGDERTGDLRSGIAAAGGPRRTAESTTSNNVFKFAVAGRDFSHCVLSSDEVLGPSGFKSE